jgi:diphosphomevalonate decarboxylase
LVLPHQSSLSLTVEPLEVRTTVCFHQREDEVVINGQAATGQARQRVLTVMDKIRTRAPAPLGAVRVESAGGFPSGAGLASSAAAFAALALAGASAAGVGVSSEELSQLARLGSGSACRSVQGGFCLWRKGKQKDGRDSFAEQVFPQNHWPELRLLVVLLRKDEKEVSSRDGMRHTVETSPYHAAWSQDAEAEAARAEAFIGLRDLEALGALVERNAWRMHASALAADPAVCYLLPKTLELILALREERKKGLPAYFTLDAGPNPILLTDVAHERAAESFAKALGALEVVSCRPGGDARIVSTPLF